MDILSGWFFFFFFFCDLLWLCENINMQTVVSRHKVVIYLNWIWRNLHRNSYIYFMGYYSCFHAWVLYPFILFFYFFFRIYFLYLHPLYENEVMKKILNLVNKLYDFDLFDFTKSADVSFIFSSGEDIFFFL